MNTLPVILLILMIPCVIVALWATIDISKASYHRKDQKWLWTNLVILFPLIGPFIYLYYGRKKLFDLTEEE